jgi:hypothetical protein
VSAESEKGRGDQKFFKFSGKVGEKSKKNCKVDKKISERP